MPPLAADEWLPKTTVPVALAGYWSKLLNMERLISAISANAALDAGDRLSKEERGTQLKFGAAAMKPQRIMVRLRAPPAPFTKSAACLIARKRSPPT
jgi:hypothetical protein